MTQQQEARNSPWLVYFLLLLTLWLGFAASAHQSNPEQDFHHHHQCRLFNSISHALSTVAPVVIVTPQLIASDVIAFDDLFYVTTRQPRARSPPIQLR